MADERWKCVPLAEVADIRTGKLDSNAAVAGGRYPFFTCSPETLRIDEYTFDCEAVLLAGNNANGVFPVKYYSGKFNAYQRTYVVTSKEQEKLDTKYLHYQLQQLRRLLGEYSIGTATKFLTLTILQPLPIPLPPLVEQKAIAHILGTLDDKIQLNRRMNETLEAMARALFKSWFVDFDPVRAKMDGRQLEGMDAATANLFPDGFEESELGPIPKGWCVKEIRELTTSIQYGLTQSASAERVGPHFLRITDIQGGRVDWSSVPYCSVDKGQEEKYRIIPGDVFVARTGASTGENIYIADCPNAVFASYLVRFQFGELAIARVVGEFMRSPAYFDCIQGTIGGSAQPNASAQVLASARLVVPPAAVAGRYLELVAAGDRKRYQNDHQSSDLAALRAALLPKLLSGEIRGGKAEKEVGRHA